MNSPNFQYCVLKYRHSIILNEILNVGLLFYFPSDRAFEFVYPNKLFRISGLYKNLNLGIIKSAQHILKNKAEEISFLLYKEEKLGSLFPFELNEGSFKDIVSKYFLLEDASALYFDDVKTGINVGRSIITDVYRKEYFACYDDLSNHYLKKDEKYIEQRLKSNLKTKLPQYHRLEINKEITTPLVTERFKWGWTNGSQNLIVPIGLDLVDPDTIKQKALSWYGKLTFLNDYARDNSISFHIITSKPDEKNLLKYYNNAVKVIEQSKAPKEIIVESELESYSDYIKNNIKL